MSGNELYKLCMEGKAGTRMNNLIFLLDQACKYDQKKAKSILETCLKKGYKLKPVYPAPGRNPDPADIYIGAITEGDLYLSPLK